MENFTFTIFDKTREITRDQWNEIFSSDMIEGYDYYCALDESNLENFSLHHAAIFRNNRICCIAPFFITPFSFDTTLQGKPKKLISAIRRKFPKFLQLKILFFGSPLTEHGIFGFSKDCDPKGVLDFLNQEISRFCRMEKIRIITCNNLTGEEMPLIENLKKLGYGVMESFPIARVEIKGNSLEEYFSSLGKNTRKDMKRKLKNAYSTGEIRIEERSSISGLEKEAYQLYLNNFNRADVAFEKLTIEYFAKVAEFMPDVTKFFIIWRGNKMVAINLCFIKGDTCIDKYFGLDYEVAYQYSLYFVSWCHNIEWCIKQGIRYYQSGTGDYEPKLRLGSTLHPLYVCAKYLNPVINLLMKYFLKMIEPGNFDPELKKLKK